MSKIRLASTVILSRGSNEDPEIYLALRSPELRFFGGYWVFPGGNLNYSIDYHDEQDPLDLALLRCAVREVLEEINILSSTLGRDFSAGQKDELKNAIRKSPESWQAFLDEHGDSFVHIDPIIRITTPSFIPVRFDTQFMHVRIRDDETPEIDNYEIVDGQFTRPAEAVKAWERGDMEIAPPVLFLLRLLAEHGLSAFTEHARSATADLERGKLHRAFFSPGIFMAPLLSPTLPPATTTNTLIVGAERLYVVDPATPDETEQQRLFEEMDERIEQGGKFEAILLTHHHEDHVGAVNAVSQRYQLPVHAHEECFRRIEPGYIKGRELEDGDHLALGNAPDGSQGWQLSVMHTPGHAVDHLCFFENRYNAAIVGDMLSTVSTILIDPPEGHMRTYIENLHRLREQKIKTLYPAHGPAHRDGVALITHFLEHREQREQAVIDALEADARSIDELLPRIYNDVPEAMYPVASRSLLAGLIKLEEDGISCRANDGWRLAQ